MMPTWSKPWLTMSATECTASASMADEPVTAYAPCTGRWPRWSTWRRSPREARAYRWRRPRRCARTRPPCRRSPGRRWRGPSRPGRSTRRRLGGLLRGRRELRREVGSGRRRSRRPRAGGPAPNRGRARRRRRRGESSRGTARRRTSARRRRIRAEDPGDATRGAVTRGRGGEPASVRIIPSQIGRGCRRARWPRRAPRRPRARRSPPRRGEAPLERFRAWSRAEAARGRGWDTYVLRSSLQTHNNVVSERGKVPSRLTWPPVEISPSSQRARYPPPGRPR